MTCEEHHYLGVVYEPSNDWVNSNFLVTCFVQWEGWFSSHSIFLDFEYQLNAAEPF